MVARRTLGRTGLRVSELGFGGAPAGLRNYLQEWDPRQRQAQRAVREALERALERGVNYLDTAPAYGDGASEAMFGRAVEGAREQVVLATKVTGATADAVRRSVEGSLERLRTDHVDVLQYHGDWYRGEQVDALLAPGGPVEAMRRLRDDGLVRHLGFTTEGVNGPAERLLARGRFDMVQVCYNLLHQHPYDPSRRAGLMYDAEAGGLGVAVMRPLTSGTLQRWLQAAGVPVQAGFDLSAALLGFVLSNPLVDVAVVGMRSAGEVDANCAAADDPARRVDLDRVHARYVHPGGQPGVDDGR